MSNDRQLTVAYHEAGPAVAGSVLGYSSALVSIVSNPDEGIEGYAEQLDSDNLTLDGMEELVVALCAGAEAQRIMEPDAPEKAEMMLAGARSDAGTAEFYLPHCDGRTIRDGMSLWGDADEFCAEAWSRRCG